ncbi:MAG: aromatic amino acid lyase [Thaumarchaeota archaeon]|nr:aromatic amino acid lyase [Nitrososphaerota archaeon]
MTVLLDGNSLTLKSAMSVVRGEKVRISPASIRRMQRFRDKLEDKLAVGEVVYGVNTGFGSLSDKRVRPGDIKKLQLNLIRSHAAGLGKHMPDGVVRAAMLIRLNGLLRGNSATRPEIAEQLMQMINRGVTPHVPEFGSLGACLPGDSLVYTNPSGPVPISEVKPGDKVYSFIGDLEKVRVHDRDGAPNNFRYHFRSDLKVCRILNVIDSGSKQTFRLQTYSREIVCTDNHPFLKLVIDRRERGQRAAYSLKWTPLKDLKPGDLILAVKSLPKGGTSRPLDLPYLQETNADFLRLLGMILGDGYVMRNMKAISIALPPCEERETYVALIARLTGKEPSRYNDSIVIHSKLLGSTVTRLGFARKALEKRVPAWVYSLPFDQRVAFLEGYIDADATSQNVMKRHKDGHVWHQDTVTFEIPNGNLVKDLRVLAISCGMRCGKVRSRDKVRGLWFNGRKTYDYRKPSKSFAFTVMKRNFFPYSYSGKVNIDTSSDNFHFDKVVSIKPDRMQQVFDIQVEGSHNFVSEGLLVHNSGDLIPSAHMALAMVGEGRAEYRGECIDAGKALARAGMKPIELQAKSGLSLINGTSFTNALACTVTEQGGILLEAGNSSVSLTSEALGACSQSFDPRLVGMKRDSGQAHVARRIRALLKGSGRIREFPIPQDPYSIRCAPQVHGAMKDSLDFAQRLVVEEMNSVSDNPIIMEDGTLLHGGNFHAQPLAMALDLLSLSISYLGVISLSRIGVLLSKSPPAHMYMASRPGLESGLMILQYAATALAAENSKHIYPTSAYPANVSGGIEDHASHGVNAGLKAVAVARNVSKILAIEMICASNFLGSDIAGVSDHSLKVCASLRKVSPLLSGDRSMSDEIERLASVVISGGLS